MSGGPNLNSYDVIIAGAGIAGATLALSLARAGLTPVLIDPVVFDDQVAPTFDGRASAIAYAAYRQWRALGLAEAPDPPAQRAEPILATDSKTRGRRPVGPFFLRFDSAEIADRSDGEPLGYLLENRHIRAALAEALKAAGIEVLAPARVANATFGPREAVVTLADGRVLTAPLVVGAEGRGSVIRREAGIGAIGWDYPQTGVVAAVRLDRPHQGVAHEYFLPGGPFAILPLTGDRASLVWTEPRAGPEAARPEIFHAHLQRRFGEVGEADDSRCSPIPWGCRAGGWPPRVALWTPPIGAPDRRPGPEPWTEGRGRPGRDPGGSLPAGGGLRVRGGAGALRGLAAVRHHHAERRHGRLRAAVLQRPPPAAPGPGGRHGGGEPGGPGPAVLHAGGRRRGGRPAAAAAG